MRGDIPLLAMGSMSPQFKALAASQDLIEWRDFTVDHILTHFYGIQSFHFAMSSSYLNGKDWTRQFISRILKLTHLQWIFRNISFHDKTNGFLRNKKPDKILQPPKSPRRMYPKIVYSSLKSTSANLRKLILKPKPTGHWR